MMQKEISKKSNLLDFNLIISGLTQLSHAIATRIGQGEVGKGRECR
jgi:hypothetical protein